jgi:hypothetical protein
MLDDIVEDCEALHERTDLVIQHRIDFYTEIIRQQQSRFLRYSS